MGPNTKHTMPIGPTQRPKVRLSEQGNAVHRIDGLVTSLQERLQFVWRSLHQHIGGGHLVLFFGRDCRFGAQVCPNKRCTERMLV